MSSKQILTILKYNLDIIPDDTSRDEYLLQLINAATALIEREGATLTDTIEDGQLIVMYAAYLYRKRATDEPMPRMLRWALNNRIFSEKMKAEDDET